MRSRALAAQTIATPLRQTIATLSRSRALGAQTIATLLRRQFTSNPCPHHSQKSLLNLFNKLSPMRHNQHITSPFNVNVNINVKVFPYDFSEHHGLPRSRRHLHHHAPMLLKSLPHS